MDFKQFLSSKSKGHSLSNGKVHNLTRVRKRVQEKKKLTFAQFFVPKVIYVISPPLLAPPHWPEQKLMNTFLNTSLPPAEVHYLNSFMSFKVSSIPNYLILSCRWGCLRLLRGFCDMVLNPIPYWSVWFGIGLLCDMYVPSHLKKPLGGTGRYNPKLCLPDRNKILLTSKVVNTLFFFLEMREWVQWCIWIPVAFKPMCLNLTTTLAMLFLLFTNLVVQKGTYSTYTDISRYHVPNNSWIVKSFNILNCNFVYNLFVHGCLALKITILKELYIIVNYIVKEFKIL